MLKRTVTLSKRSTPRATLSVRIKIETADKLRVFVKDNSGKPLYLTMGGFVEDAIEAYMKELQKTPDSGALKNGRTTSPH